MILRLKYRGARHLATPLVGLLEPSLAELVGRGGSHPSLEIVVPVPLHPTRLAARGYNQSTLLATELARLASLSLVEDGLVRLRDTPAQTGLTAHERRLNMQGAFQAKREVVKGRSILLVDDVFTTGATLASCAAALKRAGASHVDALTVARAR